MRFTSSTPRGRLSTGTFTPFGDSAAGAIRVNRYDEYGIPAGPNAGRFQYTGQVWLPEIGLYHYKARIYSPTLGRFLQTDPIGYDDQFNLYAYVGNDPVNHADPSGMCFEMTCPVNYFNERASRLTREAEAQVSNSIGRSVYEGSGLSDAVDAAANLANGDLSGVARSALNGAANFVTRGLMRPAQRAMRASGGRRPGSHGAPDHQADVRGPGRQQAEAQAQPGETVLTEQPIQGHPGVNRRPDNQIVGTDGRTRLVVESERRPNGKYHREREEQYRNCGIACQTRPLPPR